MADLSNYAVGAEAFNLRDFMDSILETVVSVYESYNVPLPSRRYWTFGNPAIDCEQAVVSFVQLYLGAPGDQASSPRPCSSPRTAVINILISRPSPVVGNSGRAPTAEAIQENSEWQAIDSWILIESVDRFDNWGDLGPGLGVIATVDAPESQGGFSSASMTITLSVP